MSESVLDAPIAGAHGRGASHALAGRVERNIDGASVSVQLACLTNDAETRANYLLVKGERYRRYSRYLMALVLACGVGSSPLWYWLYAPEFKVARQRNPLRVRNCYHLGIAMLVASGSLSLFGYGPVGFRAQTLAIRRFASLYDLLGWEARIMQYQIDHGKFQPEGFMAARRREFAHLEDDPQAHRDYIESFSDLMLKTDDADRILNDQLSEQERLVMLKAEFEQRVRAGLTPLSIAYWERLGRKAKLDEFY